MKLAFKGFLICFVTTLMFSSCSHFGKHGGDCKCGSEHAQKCECGKKTDSAGAPKKSECEACKKGS